MQTSLSLVHEARLIYAPAAYQLQAKHHHTAGLIDSCLKRPNLPIQLLCHTSRLLTSACKNPLLCKRLYNFVYV